MAGTSLLALIDDIATILDDVSVMTKVAAKKTAGVLGDDLALNAEKVTGVTPDRELPVIWAVAKGATINKVILIPAALLIATFAGFLITPLLMLGGGFLCYEGFHKVFEKLFHKDEGEKEELVAAFNDPDVDLVEFEKAKIQGAVRTDFILSAEIIVIALGTVSEEPFVTQLAVLSVIGFGMVVVVYGLVAGIVKLDDLGMSLSKMDGAIAKVGDSILVAAPWFMKALGVVGTAAMFLVGGGIIAHGIHQIGDLVHAAEVAAGPAGVVVSTALNGIVGVVAGGLISAVVAGVSKVVASVRGGE
jgi:predicted DNA repair protein MutK